MLNFPNILKAALAAMILAGSSMAMAADEHWSSSMIEQLLSRPADRPESSKQELLEEPGEPLVMRRYQLRHLDLGNAVTDDIVSLLEQMVDDVGYVERIPRTNTIAVYTLQKNHDLVWKYIQVVDVETEEGKAQGGEMPAEVRDAILQMSSMSSSARELSDIVAGQEAQLDGLKSALGLIEQKGARSTWIIVGAGSAIALICVVVVYFLLRRTSQAGASQALVVAQSHVQENSTQMLVDLNTSLEGSKNEMKKHMTDFVTELDRVHEDRNKDLATQFGNHVSDHEKRMGELLQAAISNSVSMQKSMDLKLEQTNESLRELTAKHNSLNKAAKELRDLYEKLDQREDDLDKKDLELQRLRDELNSKILEADSVKTTLASVVHMLQQDDDMDDGLLKELSDGVSIVSKQVDEVKGSISRDEPSSQESTEEELLEQEPQEPEGTFCVVSTGEDSPGDSGSQAEDDFEFTFEEPVGSMKGDQAV